MIYFDAGATTLQKPETVARAMYRAVGQLSSPGRGSYPATRAAEETDLQCRTLAARLFGVSGVLLLRYTWAEHCRAYAGETRRTCDHLGI